MVFMIVTAVQYHLIWCSLNMGQKQTVKEVRKCWCKGKIMLCDLISQGKNIQLVLGSEFCAVSSSSENSSFFGEGFKFQSKIRICLVIAGT